MTNTMEAAETVDAEGWPGGPPRKDEMEILLNLANMLYVLAYFTLDLLRLRLMTTAAAICLATYFYIQPEPMLNVVGWNLFFVALNLWQIGRILLARRRQTERTARA